MRSSASAVTAVLCLIVITLWPTGCHRGPAASAKVTKANLAKIEKGMSVADVQAVLGTGETTQTGSITLNRERKMVEQRVWKEEGRTIVVSFDKGLVVSMGGLNLN